MTKQKQNFFLVDLRHQTNQTDTKYELYYYYLKEIHHYIHCRFFDRVGQMKTGTELLKKADPCACILKHRIRKRD